MEKIFYGDYMKKIKQYFLVVLLLLIPIIFLTACDNKNTTSEDTKQKVIQELEYLDTELIAILNNLNNISLQNYTITSEQITLDGGGESSTSSGGAEQSNSSEGQQKQSESQNGGGEESKNTGITTTQTEPNIVIDSNENDIDWKEIKRKIESISNSWGIVLLDLSTLNVDNNDILEFSKTIDENILTIKDEDKIATLTNTAKLYSFIPKFESAISAPNSVQNIKQVKSYLMNAYSLVEQGNWGEIENNISECEKTFKNLMNDVEYIKSKEYKVNKAYVLIKELQNSLPYKDRKLFYVKYKNLIENINVL